uniref:Phosphatidylserine decarboxylase proenzyme n=1 Tax=Chlorobium chlorochromatii (strain CaD3) TaxID=340177 RepID=PSD_CHLCH|nr:RecName: Full=Phosphatidylserine decarboxylase proenzyme; Contains: RecName: Full=Phosphatidylserine decarboxylase alpha chain; Contains: RecName: Full=Phosphatidylserine decarboxylase beta chain [Chlorobium chlorochromatii CaD3]
MLTSYGTSTIVKTTLLCLLMCVVALFIPFIAQVWLIGFAVVFLLFTLYFFRDPERKTPNETAIIVSPADGKVMQIAPCTLPDSGLPATRVSIFMSPFNVHVNRVPISGKVTMVRYVPGKFLMAFDHASMEHNERMEIALDNGQFEVRFSQVSGFIARRIVCTLQPNDVVTIGRRFGMIKFGSRVDMVLPATVRCCVQQGDNVHAGETIIGRY